MIIAIETFYQLITVAVFSGEEVNDYPPEQMLLNDFLFDDYQDRKRLLLQAIYDITDQIGIEQNDDYLNGLEYRVESTTNSQKVDYIIFLHLDNYTIKKL